MNLKAEKKFKGCLPQILLGLFLNILTQIIMCLTILTGKSRVFLNSVQEFIEIKTLTASGLLNLFTQSINFYSFHCRMLKSTDV